ncbi:MAG: RIP metalloprotease RseP [Legionellaceae bacterium]|nr:RIP metalloprotease RseP [Legionellaceae bacterium]
MILTVLSFILALLLLICFHEYGHFVVARWCGVKVLRFSFGFGPVLWHFSDRHGTEFSWSLWPLGGYVKMLDETEGEVAAEERPHAFNRQPVWKRILIVLAGPAFNFIFAFAALWLAAVIGVYSLAPMIDAVEPGSIAEQAGLRAGQEILSLEGEPTRSWRDFQFSLMPHIGTEQVLHLRVKTLQTGATESIQLPLKDWRLDFKKPDILASFGIQPFLPGIPPLVARVVENMPAQQAGIEEGDRIVAVNGQTISDWRELVDYVQQYPGQTIEIRLMRAGQEKTINLTIGERQVNGESQGFIGLMSAQPQWPKEWLRLQRDGPLVAIASAAHKTWHLSVTTLSFIGRLISGKLSLETVSGPLGIAQGAGDSAKSGLVYYLFFLALVSISLGVLNLLPVPMLDGGHLLFYLVEIIQRKPVSEQLRLVFTYVGLLLLIALMAVAVRNDILRLLS